MKRIYLFATYCLVLLSAPILSFAQGQNKSDSLEQRGDVDDTHRSNHFRSNRKHRDSTHRHFDQGVHHGGKQNIEGRRWNENRTRPDMKPYGYAPGLKRQEFLRPGFRRYHFHRPFFKGYPAYPYRFQPNDRVGSAKRFQGHHYRQHQGIKHQPNPELKSLQEKIWKDGIMDLKEREELRRKREEWQYNKEQRIQKNKDKPLNQNNPKE